MWTASFCHPEARAGVVVDELAWGASFLHAPGADGSSVAETRADRPVFAAAQRQHGVVTTTQLLAAGWDKDVIARRVARGYLRRLQHGVYLVGPLEAEHTAAMAAVLATDGIVSSYPAAVLWDWRPPREGPMHVIASGRSRAGLVVHHTALHPHDITRRHGIPVTSAARTLLDLAATEPTAELERALNEAGLQRRVSPHSLNEQFSRYPRHRGTAALKKATRNRAPSHPLRRSSASPST